MNLQQRNKLINYFLHFVTEHKRELMEKVIKQRTKYVSLVLEDVYQSQNAAATLRTADCFGVQDIHVIEMHNKFINSSVAMGAQKWLTLQKYKNTNECLSQLKKDGYRIVATTPHTDLLLQDLQIDQKTTLVFGNEEAGVSDAVLEQADIQVKIPMFGFTESFNLSVSVALCLYDVMQKVHASNIDWHLSEQEQQDVLLEWLRNTIKGAAHLEKDFFKIN